MTAHLRASRRASRIVLPALLAVLSLCLIPAGLFAQATTQPTTEPTFTLTSGTLTLTASPDASIGKHIFDQASPSLVVVKYNFTVEFGSQDLTAPGIVVGDDGLTMISLHAVTPMFFAADQLKDFKILVPGDANPPEIDAELVARDERTNIAFIRPLKPQHWPAIHFVDALPEVGDTVYSVGLLPKGYGYRPFLMQAVVSAHLRGPVPQVLIDTGLAAPGSPVFDANGQAVGLVQPRALQDVFLDDPNEPRNMRNELNPPKTFIPASDFLQSFTDMPTKDKPVVMAWMGVPSGGLTGLPKLMADYYKLGDKPAIQVSDVVPGAPADKAGIKKKDLIIAMNGQPLERGNMEDELPGILERKIQRMHVGDKVTLTIISDGDAAHKPHDVSVTLEARPPLPTDAKRYYGEDMGLVVRDVVFTDLYQRHMTEVPGGLGVAVVRLKPQGPAEAAKLQVGDLVTQINHKPIKDLDDFAAVYKAARKEHPDDAVVLEVIQQDGKQETINIQPPQTGFSNPGGSGFGP